MPDSDTSSVSRVLSELLSYWLSGGADSINRADIQRLQLLISSATLESVWERISSSGTTKDVEIATKLLLIEVFETAKRIPPWVSLSASKRKRQLDQIDRATRRLAHLVSGSPIRYLSTATPVHRRPLCPGGSR